MSSNFSRLARLAIAGLFATCVGLAHAAVPTEQQAIVQKAGSTDLQLQKVPEIGRAHV